MREFGLDMELFHPIPGHGSTLQEMRMPFPDFSGLFDQAFSIQKTNDSDVVKVIDLFNLEKQDVTVEVDENHIVTVKGEYSLEFDATRVFEQFPEPEGMYLRSSHFVKRDGMNKLVLIFDEVSDEEGNRD
jgi:hypothetical protein